MNSSSAIAIATSIPPKLTRLNASVPIDADPQKLCIESWVACGFRIFSINDRSEIPDLSARYPQVTFVATDRSASLGDNRKPPFIADILQTLAGVPEKTVGIVNSDLLFEPTPAWRDFLSKLPEKTVATGQRYDTTSLLHNAAYRYFWGFDYFFFAREIAVGMAGEAGSFAMGLPWWDYWFPMVLALRGFRLTSLDRPATIHLTHTQSQSTMARTQPWRIYGLQLAKRIAAEPQPASLDGASQLAQTHTLCAELTALAETSAASYKAIDERLFRLAYNCVTYISAERITADNVPESRVDSAHGDDLTLPGIFAQFPTRLFAGKAFYNAVDSEKMGKSEEALALYHEAFEAAPNDTELLLTFARFHMQRSEHTKAEALIRKAIEFVPNSAHLWNSLGTLMGALNRGEEAAACFRRSLQIDPLSQDAHYYLALLLHSNGKHAEALSLLEAAFEAIPDFSEGRELEAKIRSQMPSPADVPLRA